MKKSILALVMLCVTATAHAAAQSKPATNVDWLLMTPQEKITLVTRLVEEMRSKGLPLSADPGRYAAAIDAVTGDPKLKNGTSVSGILMSVAYTKEPAVRRIVDAAQKAKAGKMAPKS